MGEEFCLAPHHPQPQLFDATDGILAHAAQHTGRFRFIGSGVIEAGCKTVIGQRVKQSGMLWSLSGADHVLAVRCALMNGDFESYWRQQGFFPAEMKKAA